VDESGANGIGDEIADHLRQGVLAPQRAIEVTPLPERFARHPFERKACQLLGSVDKWWKPGVLSDALNDRVVMVRHEAIRKNCHIVCLTGVQELRSQPVDQSTVGKVFPTPKGADRQEIALAARIVRIA